MAFTEEDAVALAGKLATMELDAGERAALDAVFAAASNGEVEGFGYTEVEWTYLKPIRAVMGKPLGFNTGKKLDKA